MIASDKRPKTFRDLILDDQIYDDLGFLRRLRNAEIITAEGRQRIRDVPNSRNVVFDLSNPTPTGAVISKELPDQTGHANQILITDGAAVSWTNQVFIGAAVTTKTAQTIPTLSGGVNTKLNFTVNRYDTNGIWSAAAQAFIIPFAGKWRASCFLSWNPNSTGLRAIHFYVNGFIQCEVQNIPPTAPNGCQQFMSDVLSLALGDRVEMYCTQTSGGNLDTYPDPTGISDANVFQIEMVGVNAGVSPAVVDVARMRWLGPYNGSTTYAANDAVIDVGIQYVSLLGTNVGNTPASSPTYWQASSSAGLSNPMTTAGDLIVGGTAGSPTRLAAGTDTYVLTMVSGSVAWAAATGGSGTPAGATTQVQYNNAGAFGASANFTYASSVLTLLNPLAANTAGDGLVLDNATTATSGNQSYSPRLRLSGRGWKTNSTAASQQVDFTQYCLPIQGTANPTGNLVWASQVNAGGYTNRMALNDAGVLLLGALSYNGGSTDILQATSSSHVALRAITTGASASARLRLEKAGTSGATYVEFLQTGSGNEFLFGSPDSSSFSDGTGFSVAYYNGSTLFNNLSITSGSNQTITLAATGTGNVTISPATTNDATLRINAPAGKTPIVWMQLNGTTKCSFGVASATNNIVVGSAANDFCVNEEGSANILFSTDGGASVALKLVASTGQVTMPKNITSTSTTTGTLVVTGGQGLSGDLFGGGKFDTTDSTDASSTVRTGSIRTTGGISASKAIRRTAGTSTTNASAGGVIFDHFADAGNTTTTETDLYSDTIAANVLSANGEKVQAIYSLTLVSSATATRQVKVYFAGTVIFDSGALSFTLSGDMEIWVTIVRDGSTTIRYSISATTTGASLGSYVSVGKLTGLTLSGTNVLKITGQSAGTGAATNDIVATLSTGSYFPAF